MVDTSPKALAVQLLGVLVHDRETHLLRIDEYMRGRQDDPYMPESADSEYRLLAERAVSNWMPLAVSTPAQAIYVDGFRRGDAQDGDSLDTPEWDHWQYSRLDAKQIAVTRGALTFGHSFTCTLKDKKGRVATRGLSALNTSALFEDPANDDTPYAALNVTQWPRQDVLGRAKMWDDVNEYAVTFKDPSDADTVKVVSKRRHGAPENPITRFVAFVDLEGRTVGLVEPLIKLQNRINQTIFDLLVAQTYGSFKVRWVTGMAPPLEMDPVYADPADTTSEIIDFKPRLDNDGNPIPKRLNHNARRFLFAEDPDTHFGSLDETPLNGYIESHDMSIRDLSAIAQIPPHHLLGQIANLSADALQAAETSLLRMVEGLKKTLGESWERVFRLAGALAGVETSANDYKGEVIWRDMEGKSMSQTADALGKLKENLEIPAQGLWDMVPGTTPAKIGEWKDLAKDQDSTAQLASAINRATVTTLPAKAPSEPATA